MVWAPAGWQGIRKEYAEEIRNLLNVPKKYTLVALVPAGLPLEITPSPKERDEEYGIF